MTKKKAIILACLSVTSILFGLIAVLGFSGPEYIYLPQGETFSCSRSSVALATQHDHSFQHLESRSDELWEEAGLDFDPLSCEPFYERMEASEQQDVSFAEKQFFWFSRISDVKPQMWQIYIEAVISPHMVDFTSSKEIELTFDFGIAVRAKNNED